MKDARIILTLAMLGFLVGSVHASVVTLDITVEDGTSPVTINLGEAVSVKIYATVTENNYSGVDLGLAGELEKGAQYRTEFLPLWQQPGLSAEEQAQLQGLYGFATTTWSKVGRDDARRMNGSLVLIYASLPDFGPGGKLWGATPFGDVRINLIYRLFTGRIFDFEDPFSKITSRKEGPTISTVDFSFQKGFNIRGVRPLLYVEIQNLFNFKGSETTSSDYLRWGLLGPPPTDPIYLQFGDVNDLDRFTGTDPRQIFAGVRVSW